MPIRTRLAFAILVAAVSTACGDLGVNFTKKGGSRAPATQGQNLAVNSANFIGDVQGGSPIALGSPSYKLSKTSPRT